MYSLELIKQDIIDAINSSLSMRQAASKINMNYNTFIKYAKQLGVYKPNPGGKGVRKNMPFIPLEEIVNGMHPQYHTYKLGKRLLKEGWMNHICTNCQLTDWLDKPIPLELDHIDGNPYNHNLENLRLLCPNCHAQTPTHRGRNKKN